jgi:hypothetical protein
MSNHYHIVVQLAPDDLRLVSDETVLQRWGCLYKGPLLLQRYLNGDALVDAEAEQLTTLAAIYRKRLTSLGWFMKCLNEPIARRANREDQCTGHFWEARYKSQPLVDDAALLSCMAYVDLNPVRARIATTPETSEHTSIRERVAPTFDPAAAARSQFREGALPSFTTPIKPLLPFNDQRRDDAGDWLPFTFKDYLALLDATGRHVRRGKRGVIGRLQPPILQRLGIDPPGWISHATEFERQFRRRQALGPPRLA